MVAHLWLVCHYVLAKQSQASRGLGRLTGRLRQILDPCAATVVLGRVVATWADPVVHACLAPNSQLTS
jgi:hypothetical protein